MNRRLRLLAGAGVIAYVLFALGFNLAVAHYRDLATSAEGSVTVSFKGLLGSPFNLSLQSAALFAIGVIASLLGLIEGLRLDDPVPGYGERHRRFVTAKEDFERSTDALRRRVLERVEALPERCQAVVRRADDVVRQMYKTTTLAHRARETYEAQREHLEDRCEVLLRRYRDENKAIRSEPNPSYFNNFPTLPGVIDWAALDELDERLARADIVLDQAKAEEHRIRRKQADRVRATAERFETCVADQFNRAEAGHGDGSGHQFGRVEGVRGGRS